jgi:hypothetical protein
MKAHPKFLEMVSHLSESQKERLLSRMRGKLPRRLLKDKINIDAALATQLEIEDEQLQDWRKQMHLMKEKSKKITEKKEKTAKQPKAEKPPNASTKAKGKSNAEATAKTKPAAKTKAATKPTE